MKKYESYKEMFLAYLEEKDYLSPDKIKHMIPKENLYELMEQYIDENPDKISTHRPKIMEILKKSYITVFGFEDKSEQKNMSAKTKDILLKIGINDFFSSYLNFLDICQKLNAKDMAEICEAALKEGSATKSDIFYSVMNHKFFDDLNEKDQEYFIKRVMFEDIKTMSLKDITEFNDYQNNYFATFGKACMDLGLGKEFWHFIEGEPDKKASAIITNILPRSAKIQKLNEILKNAEFGKEPQKMIISQYKQKRLKEKYKNFKGEICDPSTWYKIGLGTVLLAGVTLVFGGFHHLGYWRHLDINTNRDILSIEKNIEADTDSGKFTHTAIIPVQNEDGYFVEIAGTIYFDGNKPAIYSTGYKIDKDLYNQIKKYFEVEWNYGENGQITRVENNIRTNLEVCGLAKANRARAEIYDKLDEITREDTPVYTKITNQNPLEDDISQEMK